MERRSISSAKSIATDYTYESSLSAKRSLIHIEVIEAKNLAYLSESCIIQPYIQLKHLRNSYITNVAESYDNPYWGSVFDIPVDSTIPLSVILYDNDEMLGDMAVAGLYLPIDVFRKWQGDLADFWVVLIPMSSNNLTDTEEEMSVQFDFSMILRGNENLPMLHLRIDYRDFNRENSLKVSFDTFKVIKKTEMYTIYELTVHRNGKSYNTQLRYSQVYKLRQDLLDLKPEIANFPFPGKTYSEFLSLLCSNLSRFDINTIRMRKQGLERFFNYILRIPNLKTDKVHELLNISSL